MGEGLKKSSATLSVDFAHEYPGFSESVLALEALSDHIADHDVVIVKAEFSQILKIVDELGLGIDSRFAYINPDN